jgi:hypothetical protein
MTEIPSVVSMNKISLIGRYEMETTQIVLVDRGRLIEICWAAEKWAGYLRKAEPSILSPSQYEEAADRIDKAIAAVRRDAMGRD